MFVEQILAAFERLQEAADGIAVVNLEFSGELLGDDVIGQPLLVVEREAQELPVSGQGGWIQRFQPSTIPGWAVPQSGSESGSTDQHELIDAVRMRQGEGRRGPAAERIADQGRFLEPEPIEKPGQKID